MSYVTGKTIKELREKRNLTQKELAKALSVSIGELLTGEYRQNENPSGNMKKMQFYVCPVCGNVIAAVGSGNFSCCGITLPKQEAEESDECHFIKVETIENEYHVTLEHLMEKTHYVSFVAYVTSDNVEVVKLYPEQNVSVRFRRKGHGIIYVYCNRHGMFRKKN